MKDIMLKIVGNQIDSSLGERGIETKIHDSEAVELVTEGRFYKKGDSFYLIYDESEFSGMEGCTTSLKVTGDKIRMKRYGDNLLADMAIEFEKGKRFNGYYETPFGTIEMEVLTNEIKNQIEEEGKGMLDIHYFISLKGLAESRSKLSIEII